MVRKKYNYNFQQAQDYSKEDIQQLTSLSKNTVAETLRISGLPTSDRQYSGEALLEKFVPVRRLVDGGMTYEEVRKRLQMNEARAVQDETFSTDTPTEEVEFGTLDKVIGEGIAEAVYSSVEMAVEDLIEHIPQMAAIALTKAARQGKIESAFKSKLREYFAKRRTVDFQVGDSSEAALPAVEPLTEPSSYPQHPSAAWFEEPHGDVQEKRDEGEGVHMNDDALSEE